MKIKKKTKLVGGSICTSNTDNGVITDGGKLESM